MSSKREERFASIASNMAKKRDGVMDNIDDFKVTKPLETTPRVAFVQNMNSANSAIDSVSSNVPTVNAIKQRPMSTFEGSSIPGVVTDLPVVKPYKMKTYQRENLVEPPEAVSPTLESANGEGLPNIQNLPRAVSEISNTIGNFIRNKNLYHMVNGEILDTNVITPQKFYQKIQSYIYHNTLDFVSLSKDSNGKWIFPEITSETSSLPTIRFLIRSYNDKLFQGDSAKFMEIYRNKFSNDCDGIQEECLLRIFKRIAGGIRVSNKGLEIIKQLISDNWCSTHVEENINEPQANASVPTQDPQLEEKVEVIQNPFVDENDEYSSEDGDAYDDGEEYYINGVRVEIITDEDFDTITVICRSEETEAVYPFYTQLHTVPDTSHIPSIVDDRNGVWDGLIHLPPNTKFTTTDPQKYLDGNNDEVVTDTKIVILDEEDGLYYCGAYGWEIVYIDEEGEEFEYDADDMSIVAQVMHLIKTNIANGEMSHLAKTLCSRKSFLSEDALIDRLMELRGDMTKDTEEESEEGSPDDNDDDVNAVEPEMDVLTRAAFESMGRPLANTEAYGLIKELEDDNCEEITIESPVLDKDIDTTVIQTNVPEPEEPEEPEENDEFTFRPRHRDSEKSHDR